MKLITTTIVLFISLAIGAQTTATISIEAMHRVFEKVSNKYANTTDYSFNLSYTSFKGHEGNTVADKSTGTMFKSGKKMYSNMLGMETIQDNNIRILKMDSEKQLFVFEPESTQQTMDVDTYKKTLKNATKIIKKKIGANDVYIVHFNAYSSIERMVIYLSKDLFISKLKLFYAENQTYETPNGDFKNAKPRLEVAYSNISTKPVDASQFNTSKYVRSNGEVFTTTQAYRTYELNNMILSK